MPIDVSLAQLGSLGFDGIELTVRRGYTTELSRLDAAERRRILALLAQHHLALPGLHAGIELLDGDVAANLAGMRAAVDLSVDLATDNHPPVISTVMGGRPGELPALRPRLVEYLGDLAAYAAPRGVIIAVEPHVSTVLDRPEQVGPLLAEINSPFLRATFDISHFNVQGMPIEETVAIMAPLAAHTHVKDERGRAPHHEFLIPGEGEFDYVRYLRAMRAVGYDDFITVEVSIMVQRRPDYDALAAATQSYNVLSRAFSEAGIVRER